ncbi:atp-binding cassette superfamily [Phytophthora cinnamomi]|uniref:atp-binding cassette superfamily n=1 Tax=Phytophthora cinnamomi TaxID=4785 RepID=UPI00355AA986|nr:atp-binding cassette superfamily [Phytophthora cinnamomi]
MVRLTEAIAVLSLVSALVDPVVGYQSFVAKLPNGDNVSGVAAIGHVNVDGGGPRNAFGTDFDDMGQAWTTELCKTDSDGDGQTNGEELGDPCCEWDEKAASTPLWTKGVSNPGDKSSTSDKSAWPAYTCSSTNSTSSSTSSNSGSHAVDVGQKENTTATTASSSSGSCTTKSATTSRASTAAKSAIGGLIALVFALVA